MHCFNVFRTESVLTEKERRKTRKKQKDREKNSCIYAERQAIIFTKCQIIHQYTSALSFRCQCKVSLGVFNVLSVFFFLCAFVPQPTTTTTQTRWSTHTQEAFCLFHYECTFCSLSSIYPLFRLNRNELGHFCLFSTFFPLLFHHFINSAHFSLVVAENFEIRTWFN